MLYAGGFDARVGFVDAGFDGIVDNAFYGDEDAETSGHGGRFAVGSQ